MRSAPFVALLAAIASCKYPVRNAPPTSAVISPPDVPSQQVIEHPIAWPSYVESDLADGADMKGQLDRIERLEQSKAFLNVTKDFAGFWSEAEPHLTELRNLAADKGRSADPRFYMAMTIAAQQRVHRDGPVLYKMLTKNPHPFAGRPWFVMGAKIDEIKETDEGVTIGRLELEPGFEKTVFFAARFPTPFIDDDRVDIIGYFAGEYTYKNRIDADVTIPAFAVAGIFKPGTILAMNRIVRFWKGDIGPDQLRREPRKF